MWVPTMEGLCQGNMRFSCLELRGVVRNLAQNQGSLRLGLPGKDSTYSSFSLGVTEQVEYPLGLEVGISSGHTPKRKESGTTTPPTH